MATFFENLLFGTSIAHSMIILALTGVIAGSCTNPPVLAFANQQNKGGEAAIGYATVYPLAMFMRILVGQMMILLFC